MRGIVDADLEATIALRMRDQGGDIVVTAIATVDTGFTESLLLPRQVVQALRLSVTERDPVILGDGSEALLDVHLVDVEWFGGWRTVEAYAGQEKALIGVSLLEQCRLVIDFVPDGEVRVEPF